MREETEHVAGVRGEKDKVQASFVDTKSTELIALPFPFFPGTTQVLKGHFKSWTTGDSSP